ncbi:uncharacterized protein BDZ99DRAFT_539298 [Mytilinidion resinicola]|uniref:Uncharacterized protein n=1 Tax=Mytilinidion resinicola TaxID=574789 RepID=A0A6A6YAY5_9PEZI|nr:uncharacterized protein BDZ99DRAFT_539298 [Mytilinidion resinicola]KAF2805981.1 hypothetical protein BDZ99DRAFT_539298 [Mytilinidion resinicola]
MVDEVTLRLLRTVSEISNPSTYDHSVSYQEAATKSNADLLSYARNIQSVHQERFIPAYSQGHYSQQPLPDEPVLLGVSQNPKNQSQFREEMETAEPVIQDATSVSTPLVSEHDSGQDSTCASLRRALKRVKKSLGSTLQPFGSNQKAHRKKDTNLRGYQKLI